MAIGRWKADDRWMARNLPRMKPGTFRYTSDDTFKYNCLAFAAGETHRWWEPNGEDYWPSQRLDYSLAACVEAFAAHGFESCDNGDVELGFEKIVLFAKENQYKHAARLVGPGRWTSKLGEYEDIEHSLDEMNGGEYGSVAVFMKRKSRGDAAVAD